MLPTRASERAGVAGRVSLARPQGPQVDHTSYVRPFAGLQEVPDAPDVDLLEGGIPLPKDAHQVDDRVHPFHRRLHARRQQHVPLREGDGEVRQRSEVGGRAMEATDRVSCLNKGPNQMPAQEARGPRHQDTHEPLSARSS